MELKTNSPVNETCSNSIWNLLSHPSAIVAVKNQIEKLLSLSMAMNSMKSMGYMVVVDQLVGQKCIFIV